MEAKTVETERWRARLQKFVDDFRDYITAIEGLISVQPHATDTERAIWITVRKITDAVRRDVVALRVSAADEPDAFRYQIRIKLFTPQNEPKKS